MNKSTCLGLLSLWMLCCEHGKTFKISTEFKHGKLKFQWTYVSTVSNNITITKDFQPSDWIKVDGDQYTVEDVIQYKSVNIRVREFDTTDLSQGYLDYNKTCIVNTVEAKEGESKYFLWTADYFPKSGLYLIFHVYNDSVSTIMQIGDKDPSTEKYVYHTRPLDSVNIQFEVKNITVQDAGYYAGGPSKADALTGEGVVLVVFGKPVKAQITGNLNIQIRRYAYLKCESISTSAPSYYQRFPPLTYSWFVNNSRLEREVIQTYRFTVTDDAKYNRYSCQAKETLESEKSEEIQINPLYGPRSVIISPTPGNEVSVHEGGMFGPYNCSSDCNPPCTLQWKYSSSKGDFLNLSSAGNFSISLPKTKAVRANITFIRCEVNGTEKTEVSDIKLNIQYGPENVIIFPTPGNEVSVREGGMFGPYRCSSDCNPVCTLQWKYNSSKGDFLNLTSVGSSSIYLPKTKAVRANMTFIRCEVNGIEKTDVLDIKLNIQYGPNSVIIFPKPGNEVSVHEGGMFGPYNCSSDCNPSCTLQWKYRSSKGDFLNLTSAGSSSTYLPKTKAVRANMTFVRCEVNGIEKTEVSDIKLNIQYLLEPRLYFNGKPSNALIINETDHVFLSCFVEGNPIPEVSFLNLTGNQNYIHSVNHRVNYTLIRMVQCSDTGTFECVGQSTEFGKRNQSFSVNVLCDPRLDELTLVNKIYRSSSGPGVKVVVSLPVVANPLTSTSEFVWLGPKLESISLNVSQRDNVVYKHWINSTIPVPDEESFGTYSLKYKGKDFADITIHAKDSTEISLTTWIIIGGFIGLTILLLTIIGVYKLAFRRGIRTVSIQQPQPAHDIDFKVLNRTFDDIDDATVEEQDQNHSSQTQEDVTKETEQIQLLTYCQNVSEHQENHYERLKPI